MFVVQQKIADAWVDYSCHSISDDADWQKSKLLASGVSEENAQIVDKETYSPPNRL